MYSTEASLVGQASAHLATEQSPFGECHVAHEFGYSGGRVAIVATAGDGRLLAFEAKLANWRKALQQAYRASSFAHYSFVVMPSQSSAPARRAAHEFARRGVGLCVVDDSGITIEIEASGKDPLQPWLTNTAIDYVEGEGLGGAAVV